MLSKKKKLKTKIKPSDLNNPAEDVWPDASCLSMCGSESADDHSDNKVQYGQFDLLQVAAMLLIPTLVKAKENEATEKMLEEEIVQPPPDLLKNVLRMILEDVSVVLCNDGRPTMINFLHIFHGFHFLLSSQRSPETQKPRC